MWRLFLFMCLRAYSIQSQGTKRPFSSHQLSESGKVIIVKTVIVFSASLKKGEIRSEILLCILGYWTARRGKTEKRREGEKQSRLCN